ISEDKTTVSAVLACFERTKELLGTDVEFAYCPHPTGPPVCWCRKPLPGLVLQFAFRHRLALNQCLLIGRSPADRTLAARIGMNYSAASTARIATGNFGLERLNLIRREFSGNGEL